MSDDLKPGTPDESQIEEYGWTQYESNPARDAAAVQYAPLLASSEAPSDPVRTRPLSLAFLAAAVAALVGGLVWAGIVVATGYNIGFVAFFIGAGTGLTAQLVHRAPIGGFERGLAGVFAAGAVIVGNYVIFVHVQRTDFHASAGYLDGHEMSVFLHNIGTIIHGFDWFWVALAAFAAIRTTGGGMGRTRS